MHDLIDIQSPYALTSSAAFQALDSYMATMDPSRKLLVVSYVGVWVKVRCECNM